MQNLRSTFPLDEAAIGRKALRQIIGNPISWGPLIPIAVAGVFLKGLLWLWVLLGIGAIAAVVTYWRKQWPGIIAQLRREWVQEHNRLQDLMLKKSADDFQGAKENAMARRLEQFRIVKRKVETRLHEDGEITDQKIELEQLVDALCFNVRDQLDDVLIREGKGLEVDRDAVLAHVDDAYRTLQGVVAELDTILGPSLPPGGPIAVTIAGITQRLQEEVEIARRVRSRLQVEEESFSHGTPQLGTE